MGGIRPSCPRSVQPPRRFLDADQVMRQLRYPSAHGSHAEQSKTSLQQLLSGAGSVDTVAVGAVQNYVRLLNQFSSRNSPPDIDPTRVFVPLKAIAE